MTQRRTRITAFLERSPDAVFVTFAIVASFSTYFCMYAFRKPFGAGKFEGLELLGWNLKEVLVISQLLGYALSKFIGIKVCSEVTPERRARALIVSIVSAELALIAFAAVPSDWVRVSAMFVNGLSLGMVWGFVVWYLEGRCRSELLLAGLSCSFIIASGVVKDIGTVLIDTESGLGISEWWMPAAVGGLFLPLYALSVWLLNQIPHPTPEDIDERVKREPMGGGKRTSFIRQFLPGLVMLCVAYFFLTAYRDFRDNFGPDLLTELGETRELAGTETLVAFGVLAVLAALNLVRDNRMGLIGAYVVMTVGVLLIGGGTLLLDAGLLGGRAWFLLVGLGSYLAYVPYGSVLFDRLIASTRVIGTAVFAIYVADFIGYLGSISVLAAKNWFEVDSRLDFFRGLSYVMAGLGAVMLVGSCAYFLKRHVREGR